MALTLTGLWDAIKKPLWAVVLAAIGYVAGAFMNTPAEAPAPVVPPAPSEVSK